MTTTTRTSTTPRLGTRMVAALGTAASVVALGAATAAPVSARPAGTSSAGSSASTTSDWCNRDLGAGSVSFSKRSWPLFEPACILPRL